MKKILIAAIALLDVLVAWNAGKTYGINHVLENAEYSIVDAICLNWEDTKDPDEYEYWFGGYTDPTGEKYDGRIYIDLDGNYYEHGFYIG